MKEIKTTNSWCNANEGGKRIILKETLVVSTAAVERALSAAERATKTKKKTQWKGRKKQVIASTDKMESSTDNGNDALEPLEPEMLHRIEVAES